MLLLSTHRIQMSHDSLCDCLILHVGPFHNNQTLEHEAGVPERSNTGWIGDNDFQEDFNYCVQSVGNISGQMSQDEHLTLYFGSGSNSLKVKCLSAVTGSVK